MKDSVTSYVESLIELSESPLTDMTSVMKFVCAIYGFENCSGINMARQNKLYKLAGRKASGELKKLSKVNCAMLPPCEKALWMKFKRSTLIAIVWGRADEKVPAEGLDPVDFGFKLENDRRFVKKIS